MVVVVMIVAEGTTVFVVSEPGSTTGVYVPETELAFAVATKPLTFTALLLRKGKTIFPVLISSTEGELTRKLQD